MSADNGVYILKTGKQYRVKHLQAIDNLYWDNNGNYHDHMLPTKIVKMFGECKYTYSADKALNIALTILDELSICEYGIVLLDAKKSWKEIIKESAI